MTNPSILYIEDDPLSRKVMEILLTNRLGFSHVTILEDSNNFMANIEQIQSRPELIFLDIHMTPYNGFEILAALRQEPAFQHVPIIALTASVMNEEVEQLQNSGFDGCIAKPIDAATFPDLLTQIMQGESVWQIVTH